MVLYLYWLGFLDTLGTWIGSVGFPPDEGDGEPPIEILELSRTNPFGLQGTGCSFTTSALNCAVGQLPRYCIEHFLLERSK